MQVPLGVEIKVCDMISQLTQPPVNLVAACRIGWTKIRGEVAEDVSQRDLIVEDLVV